MFCLSTVMVTRRRCIPQSEHNLCDDMIAT